MSAALNTQSEAVGSKTIYRLRIECSYVMREKIKVSRVIILNCGDLRMSAKRNECGDGCMRNRCGMGSRDATYYAIYQRREIMSLL